MARLRRMARRKAGGRYEELNKGWNFFATGTPIEKKISEFVHPVRAVPQDAAQREIVIQANGWPE